MAGSAATPGPDFLTPEEQAAEADAQQWATVSEDDVDEEKFTFDVLGDQFIGDYIGVRIVDGTDGKITQFRFTAAERFYFINAGWSLIQGMSNVRKGMRVRITWTGERDTGQPSKMRLFRVDVSKVKPTSPAPLP